MSRVWTVNHGASEICRYRYVCCSLPWIFCSRSFFFRACWFSLANHNSSCGLALTLQPRASVTFEFIDVEDKDARRKARSHVIREAKQRQKLETLRYHKNREGNKRSLAPAVISTKTVQSNEVEITPNQNQLLVKNAVSFLPSINTVLEGLVDPFNQFPVKLTSGKDLGLVDHCKSWGNLTASLAHLVPQY